MKRNLKKLFALGAALATVALLSLTAPASAVGPSLSLLDESNLTPTRILVSENFKVVSHGGIAYGLEETHPGSTYIAQSDQVQVASDGFVKVGPTTRYNEHAFKDIQFRLLGIR